MSSLATSLPPVFTFRSVVSHFGSGTVSIYILNFFLNNFAPLQKVITSPSPEPDSGSGGGSPDICQPSTSSNPPVRLPAKMMKSKLSARVKRENALAPIEKVRNQYIDLLQRRREMLDEGDRLKELTGVVGLVKVKSTLAALASLMPSLM